MSSGSKGGSNTNTTTTQTNPTALAAYQNAVSTGTNVAQQPYPVYNSPLVAGFTPTQQSAFQNINNAAGLAQPYIGQAANLIQASTSGINPAATLDQYMSPYTQSVVKGLTDVQNQQNAQQQNQLVGQAIGAGAFGGDRAQIAQSVLAGQQALGENPAIANALQSGYNSALQTGLGSQEANAWLNSQGAFALGNLGNEAQNAALAGASAQLQAGNQQQALAQNQLGVPYQQFQQAQAYPFTISNFLSGLAGNAAGAGSTVSTPGPSYLSQGLGLGTAGLGLYNAYNTAFPETWSPAQAQAASIANGDTAANGIPIPPIPPDYVPGFARGGVAHYDDGGAAGGDGLTGFGLGLPGQMTPGVSPFASTGLGSGNPQVQQQVERLRQMPTEKLREMAVRMPPGSSQGQMVQTLLHQRQMSPQADPAAAPPPGLAGMAFGGALHRDEGGSANGGLANGWVTNEPVGSRLGRFLQQFRDTAPYRPDVEDASAYTAPNPFSLIHPPESWDLSRSQLSAGQRPTAAERQPASNALFAAGDMDPRETGAPTTLPPADIPETGGQPAVLPDNTGETGGQPAVLPSTGDDGLPLPPAYAPPPGGLGGARRPGIGGGALPTPPVPPEAIAAQTGLAPQGESEQPHAPSFLDALTTGPSGALIAAGLGMLSGQSPHAAVNIGQGGLAGLNFAQQERVRQGQMALKHQQEVWNHEYQLGRLANTSDRTQAMRDNAQLRATNAMAMAMARIGSHATTGDLVSESVGDLLKSNTINPDTDAPYTRPEAVRFMTGLAGKEANAQRRLDQSDERIDLAKAKQGLDAAQRDVANRAKADAAQITSARAIMTAASLAGKYVPWNVALEQAMKGNAVLPSVSDPGTPRATPTALAPIEVKSSEDYAAAPSGSVVRYNGQLFRKP